MKRFLALLLVTTLSIGGLSACSGDKSSDKSSSTEAQYPDADHTSTKGKKREASRGSLGGEGGLTLFGGKNKDDGAGANIGVNGFLWRATLDTLSFMPIASADPFGGVIITDWYEDPKTPGERYKVNGFILDRSLRADAIKIKLFKQAKNKKGSWQDAEISPKMERDLEDTILTRARQLRVTQLETK